MIKYFCDICEQEIPSINDLICVKVQDNQRPDEVMACSLCHKCHDRIFKPVKHWEAKVLVVVPLNKERKTPEL